MNFVDIIQNVGMVVLVFCFFAIPVISVLSAFRSRRTPSPEEFLAQHLSQSLGEKVSVRREGTQLYVLRG